MNFFDEWVLVKKHGLLYRGVWARGKVSVSFIYQLLKYYFSQVKSSGSNARKREFSIAAKENQRTEKCQRLTWRMVSDPLTSIWLVFHWNLSIENFSTDSKVEMAYFAKKANLGVEQCFQLRILEWRLDCRNWITAILQN